jgi:[ribosomal protein S5]-alanine N-acetyltransferase
VSHPGLERVETQRLILERLRAEHADELPRLLSDPRVARTLSAGGRPPSDAEIRQALVNKNAHWERLGFGLWLVRDRDSGQMLGQGGLQSSFIEGANEIEVAWAIIPERWGQGLATELANAAIDAAFGELALPEIVAFALPDNHASRRVMEKTRFVFERRVIHAGLEHVLYRRLAKASSPA